MLKGRAGRRQNRNFAGGRPDLLTFYRDPRRSQPQERSGCVFCEAGNCIRQDSEFWRIHQQGINRNLNRLGENEKGGESRVKGLVLDLRDNPVAY